ncbi:MAG: PQQ-binding-like beta-propeller repeat protein [Gemmatimonadota bacterium]
MTQTRRSWWILPFSFLALAWAGHLPAQQHPASPGGGYTTEQANRGRTIYGTYCAGCHGTGLEGAVGPALAGPVFLRKWGAPGRDAQKLFHLIRATMPKPAVGSLSPEAYAQVFAYVLKRNGLPAGDDALDGSAAALQAIHLDQLAGPGPRSTTPAPDFIPGERGTTPSGTGPDQTELTAAGAGDWVNHTGGYGGQRYSALGQITVANASRLQVVCAYQMGSAETFETGPLVYHGTMYLTTPRITAAIDAATCRRRWSYTWEPRDEMPAEINRGAAIKDGYVVRGSPDGYLMALDAADGHLLWARQVARPGIGEIITMPPLVFEDMVIIGPAGSEAGIQGWIGAFKIADGTPVWRFNTIPQPGEPGSETWANATVPIGGGAVWTPLSLDVAKGELYVAVTNPAPDFPAELRPGKNLYTNALVALDVRTGRLRWYEQLVPNDAHDWDLTQVAPLFRARVRGRLRNLITAAGKDGMVTVLDRDTHERLFQTAVSTRENVDAPLTRAGTRSCPGLLGGVEWNGPAWLPATNMLYVPSVDWCMTFKLADSVKFVPGEGYLGGDIIFDPPEKAHGWLTAIDVRTGAIRWRYHSPKPMVAAVTTTAGRVVFTGEKTGDFLALDARSGRELYRFNTGAGLMGGLVTYSVGGRQYVATASGGGSLNFGREGAPTIFVFALPQR